MTLLVSGLALFFLIHLVPMVPRLRSALVGYFGLWPYKGAFAMISLAGLALVVYGYVEAEFHGLWAPPRGARVLVLPMMFIAFVLLVAAYFPNNLRRIVRHPMLAAVILWALSHLLVRGDLASLLLFGGFLAYSLLDWWSANRRGKVRRPGPQPRWRDGVVIAAGTFAYLMMIWAHPVVIGVPVR